ncbi:MAG: hypothetical protein MPJ22_07655, partial [Pirellulales bacterium]|nr:hypothetical protein [Pirellulales bacterium]
MRLAPGGGGADSACKPVEEESIDAWVHWSAARILSAKFVEIVASHLRPVDITGAYQIHIECAIINGHVHLANKEVEMALWIRNSFFSAGINIDASHFHRIISFDGSVVNDTIDGGDAVFDRGIHLEDGKYSDVWLVGAKIGGQLVAIGSMFTGRFFADGIEVTGGIFFRGKATFKKEIRLQNAKVDGSLSAAGSTFEGNFHAQGIAVSSSMFLGDETEFCDGINLTHAHIGGALLLSGARIAGAFDLEDARVVKSLDFFEREEENPKNPKWSANAKIILRNAYVGSLRAQMPESWSIEKESMKTKQQQMNADLFCFTYDRLDTQDANYVDPKALIAWIKNATSVSYIPQPYTQLAKVLHEMGAEDAAKNVEIAWRSHYYKTLAPKTCQDKCKYPFKKIWGWIRAGVDRYGVRPWLSLLWFGGFALLGALLNYCWFLAHPELVPTVHFVLDCLRYSIENMLPIPGV